MVQPRHDERGFTLVEVLIGISILVIGLLGMVGLFNSSILMNRQSTEVTQATNFALQRLEELRNTPFDMVVSKGGAEMAARDSSASAELAAYGLPPTDITKVPPTGATWNREVQVIGYYPTPTTIPPPPAYESLKSVVVTVNWAHGDPSREVRLVTYIARTGLNKSVTRTVQGP